jgi:hypothetical protein
VHLALENGDEAAVAALLAEHPDHAAAVRAQLERLEAIGILHARQPKSAIPERLGEFRLLRQLRPRRHGRGYLAEQQSLRPPRRAEAGASEHLFFPGAPSASAAKCWRWRGCHIPASFPIFTCGEAKACRSTHGVRAGLRASPSC